MALTQYTADTDIIETLGTNPEDRPTLTDNTFKAKFDENSANIAAFLNAMIAELASVSAEKGASCIGLQDSAGRFTATKVEAALAEIAGSGRTTETVKGLADLISTKPTMTTANLTYYVAKTGSDSNNGLTAGTPFLTIGKAISMIPKIVNHIVVVNVASGTYNEMITLVGFTGGKGISILGGTDISTAENFICTSISILQCSIGVYIRGLKLTSTTSHTITILSCANAFIQYCTSISTSSFYGLCAEMSLVKTFNCLFSNKNIAIIAKECSTVYSANQYAGVGNTVGLYTEGAATIGKFGAQPQGTTAEQSAAGGVIR